MAKGGYGFRDDQSSEFWIALYRKNESRPFKAYSGKHRFVPTCLTINRNGTLAASADSLGDIHIWNPQTCEQVRRISSDRFHRIWAVSWKDNETLKFGTNFYPAREWKTNRNGGLNQRFSLRDRQVLPNTPIEKPTSYLVSGAADYQLKLVNLGDEQFLSAVVNGTPRAYHNKRQGQIRAYQLLKAIPGLSVPVAIGYEGGHIELVDFGAASGQTYTPNQSATLYEVPTLSANLIGHLSQVTCIAQSPKLDLIATSAADGSIRIWRVSDLKPYADLDFRVRGNQVLSIGAPSTEAGLKIRDRVLRVDGMTYYESRELAMERKFKLGQIVRVDIERPGVDGEPDKRMHVSIKLAEDLPVVRPMLSFLITKKMDWVLWAPTGYYDSTIDGDQFIGWHRNLDRKTPAIFDNADAFSELMRRKDVINELVSTHDFEQAVAHVNETNPKLIPIPNDHRTGFASILKPEIKVISPSNGEINADSVDVRCSIEIGTVREENAQILVRIKNNKSVIEGWSRKKLTIPAGESSIPLNFEARLSNGINQFEIVAWSSDNNVESKVTILDLNCTTKPINVDSDAKLVVLTIGISKYMDSGVIAPKFASTDARLIDSAVRLQESGKLYRKIVVKKPILDEKATYRDLNLALDWFISQMSDSDYGLVYFAGCGKTIDDEIFLLPHDFIPGSKSTAIRFNEFSSRLQECPGKVMVVLDASPRRSDKLQSKKEFTSTGTSASVVNRREVEDAIRMLSNRRNGLFTITSCLPSELSVESNDVSNGAFAIALSEAIGNRRMSDLRSSKREYVYGAVDGILNKEQPDGLIKISELQQYVTDRVGELTLGRQHPQFWPKSTVSKYDFRILEAASEKTSN